MLEQKDAALKFNLQEKLRQLITPGSIDVNIMTKLDGQNYHGNEALPYEYCDAAAALRGFAQSDIEASIVLSAGFNPRLYGYIANRQEFLPDQNGKLKKKICLKVSDYRSAEIQGKYLAKRGIWISEYRIESPLNCGGHAFINDGQLLGPILEEFKQRKDELVSNLASLYNKAVQGVKNICSSVNLDASITAQGGIGTNEEQEFLVNNYNLAATGWGSPFLLVPETTNVDANQIKKLLTAQKDDVYLSPSSPLGVPFWNLRNSDSELKRQERVANKNPGAACIKGYARLMPNSAGGRPLCRASQQYQKQQLEKLAQSDLNATELEAATCDIISKACICHDLAGGATIKNGIDTKATPAICPGPNILNFKKLMTLKEIIDHIYGRCSALADNQRVNLFITEAKLQISNLANEAKKSTNDLSTKLAKRLQEIKDNIGRGLDYYQKMAQNVFKQQNFTHDLDELKVKLDKITIGK